MAKADAAEKSFRIYRRADAPTLAETGCMTPPSFSPDVQPFVAEMYENGLDKGEEVRVLVNIPGFSLAHVWFKKGFPLSLHSHDVDCLYYIIAGELRMGTQTIGARDAFFIPAGVPYTYTPGPDGVELLEFRHANSFNFINKANGLAFWEKALETVKANSADWEDAKRPTLNA